MAYSYSMIYAHKLMYRQITLGLVQLTENIHLSTLLSYWGLLDLILLVRLRVCVVSLSTVHLPAPPILAIVVQPLQDVDGVIDKQGQPGQAKEDP